MKTTRSIGTAVLVASIAAYGCSSPPQSGNATRTGGGDHPGSGPSSGGDLGASASGSGAFGNSYSMSGGGQGSTNGVGTGGATKGTPGSTGSSKSSSDASDGLCVTAGAMNNPEIDYSSAPITLTMMPFSVPAGEEVYRCENFANPWGKQVDIKDYTLNMGPGSHHMFAFYQPNAIDGAVMECPAGGLTYAPFTFTAQTAHTELAYPPTVGATIPATMGFMLDAHYVNSGSAEVHGSVALTMYIAKSGAVTNPAGFLFLDQTKITVDASCTTASGGCPSTQVYQLPQDVNMLTAGSHMHKFGTHFVATTSTGITLYETTDWDQPAPTLFCPTIHLTSGTSITWQCTDVNDTGSTLTFGEFAQSNVMCIAAGVFYPVLDVTNPMLGP